MSDALVLGLLSRIKKLEEEIERKDTRIFLLGTMIHDTRAKLRTMERANEL